MRREATQGAIWSISGQALQFALYLAGMVLLARYLDKAQLGLAALVLVVIGFLGCGADLGMGLLAVSRRHVNDRRAHGIAVWSGLGLFLLVVLLAPAIDPALGSPPGFVILLRAGATALLIAGFASNARARLQRTFSFRALALTDVGVELLRAVGRVGFAAHGFGAWSIVLGDLIAFAVGAAAAWLVAPRMRLAGDKRLIADGLRIVGARAADGAFVHADRFAVGSILGASQLGLYGFAYLHTLTALQRLTAVAELVALPILSRQQDSLSALRRSYLALTRIYGLVALAAAGLLYLYAGRLVAWLYPERWEEAVPAMLALTFAMAAAGLNSHPGLVWIALGRMRLRLWWSLANLALLAVVLTIGATLGGIEGVAYGLAVRSLLATVVAQVITREVVRVRHLAYLKALLPGIALWLLLMGIAWMRGA